MAETGNPDQWGPDRWPPESVTANDISVGKCYVCVRHADGASSPDSEASPDGEVCGTFYYDFGPEPEPDYKGIAGGEWLSAAPYGVVHRIAADRSVRGIGTCCLNWAIKESGGHLRIDTHPQNAVMRSLLLKLGFSERGTVMIGGTKLRIGYEFLG
ncbi:MAG: GNAT family N-acetyltransferase [Clostridia bacterium]|nr:GNAT family N-acetyltransferase [Clostridia bacterium]